jgi:hypothetical protein
LSAQNGDVGKTVSNIKATSNAVYVSSVSGCMSLFGRPQVSQGVQIKYGCAATTDFSCTPGIFGTGVNYPAPFHGILVFPNGDVTITQCVTKFLNGIVEIQNEFIKHQKLMEISSPCASQTESLEANPAISNAFQKVTLEQHEIGGEAYYQYSNSSPYKVACQTNGGSYSELDVTLSCKGRRSTSGEVVQTPTLNVANRPRCYGLDCKKTDQDNLFEKYTLRPTEELERQKDPGVVLVCSGTIDKIDSGGSSGGGGSDGGSSGGFNVCELQSQNLLEVANIKSTLKAMTPEMSDIKKLIFFKEGVKVNFLDNTLLPAFRDNCAASNGTFNAAPLVFVTCDLKRSGGINTVKESQNFQVDGYPGCYGQDCTIPVDSSLVAKLFTDKMVSSGLLAPQSGFQWDCTATSGTLRSRVTWVALTSAVMGLVWMILIS